MEELTKDEIDEIKKAIDYRENNSVFPVDITGAEVRRYYAKINRIREKLDEMRLSGE